MGGTLQLSMLSREEIIASDRLKPLILLSSIPWQTPPQGTSRFISFLFSCGFLPVHFLCSPPISGLSFCPWLAPLSSHLLPPFKALPTLFHLYLCGGS